MKIRECLVSNSSSSSFMIIGKELSDLPEKIGNKNIYATSNNFSCGEGTIVIRVTQEIADFIKKNKEKFDKTDTNFIFYDAFLELTEGLEFKSGVKIPKDSKVFSFNRDQSSPEDFTQFKEMCKDDELV